MNWNKHILTALISLLLLSSHPIGNTLTLEEVIKNTYTYNHDIIIKQKELKALHNQSTLAEAGFLPNLDLTYTKTKSKHSTLEIWYGL